MVPFELLSFFRCIPVGSFGCFFFWWFLFLFPPFLHLSFTFDTMISVYFYVYPFFFILFSLSACPRATEHTALSSNLISLPCISLLWPLTSDTLMPDGIIRVEHIFFPLSLFYPSVLFIRFL